MAINYDNYIIHIKKSGQKLKKFQCTCDSCGRDRGFLPKAKAFTTCLPCKVASIEYKDKHQKTIKSIRSTLESRQKTKNQMHAQYGDLRFKKEKEKAWKKANPNWQYTKKWRENISKSLIGKPSPKKGVAISQEQKIKQSCSIRGIDQNEFNGFAKDSLQNKIAHNLRSRLANYLKKNNTLKKGSAIKDLGCSVEQFQQYIEGQFEPWMNWDNYGRFNKNKSTWNIDHIRPLSSFDLTDHKQFKEACHYTNLQPMLAYENSSLKSDRIDYKRENNE